MKRNSWLVACVAMLLCGEATAQDDFGPITPNTLRVEPIRAGDPGSWILLKDHREIGSPTFSPDEQWIAFDGYQRGYYGSDAEVWIVRRDGTELRKLTTGATPRWSPDGKRLLFMREKTMRPGAKLGIFVIDRDGKNERFVCPGRWPDWAPDGKQIAFSRDSRDVPSGGVKSMSRVYVAKPDGSDAKVIADGDGPSWSPDGKKIACCYRDPGGRAPAIRIVDLEAGSQQIIGYGWYRANWSPDGKRVVANGYTFQGQGMVELSVLSPSRPEPLFAKYRQPASPCYSADGKYVVFVARRPPDDPER